MFGGSGFLWLAAAVVLVCSGCAQPFPLAGKRPSTRVENGFKVTRNLVFTPAGWPEDVPADLFQPRPAKGPAPAVLLIHGGGWTGGDGRWQMEPIARKLVKRGYVVLNVTYRQAPKFTFPAPVHDMRQALRWMLENAAEAGIDPDRIATFGYSAGGYLADFTGFTGPDRGSVRAIVAGGAPTDLTFYAGGDLVPQFVGGQLDEVPEKFRAASPVHFVTSESPPMFLYHGTADDLVRLEHPAAMIRELQRHGVPYETYWIENRGHIPAFLFPASAVNRAIDFLDREL